MGKNTSERWIAGSIGPGTKFPSLGQIGFEELRQAYEIQANALLAGGVDLFLIETVFDLLQAKAAIAACRRAMRTAQRQIPIQVQVTLESTGQMLPGTDISAVLTALEGMRPDAIGINCSTGPLEMREGIRYLTDHSTVPVACQPNAGLPKVIDGHMHYDLTADELADYLKSFIEDLGVSIVGGCCGTTPKHLSAVVRSCKSSAMKHRIPNKEPAAASLYTSVPFKQETSFLIIGERANANGSKSFREAMLSGDYNRAVSIARQQIKTEHTS
jgi:methionine synthase (B12-dependent) (EC 2.1.1.13)